MARARRTPGRLVGWGLLLCLLWGAGCDRLERLAADPFGARQAASSGAPLEPRVDRERVARAQLEELEQIQALCWTVGETRRLLLDRDFDVLEARLRDVQRRYRAGQIREGTAWCAFRAFQRHDPELREALDAWVERSPDSWVALYARGAHFRGLGVRVRGDRFLRDTEPSRIQAMRSAFEEARRSLGRACELEPAFTLCWSRLLEVHKYIGPSERIDEIARRGISEVPATFGLRRSWIQARAPAWGGSHAQMRAIARDALRHVETNPQQQLLGGYEHALLAEAAWRGSGCASAIEPYRRALAFGPNASWYRRLGTAQWCSGDAAGAVGSLDEALRFAPQDTTSLRVRARAHRDLGQGEQALLDLETALRLAPRDAQSLELRGVVLAEAERFDEAYESLRAAVGIDPERSAAWDRLGNIDASHGRWEAAAGAFRRYVALEPDRASGWIGLTVSLWQTGHPDADDTARRALERIDPDDPYEAGFAREARARLAERDG